MIANGYSFCRSLGAANGFGNCAFDRTVAIGISRVRKGADRSTYQCMFNQAKMSWHLGRLGPTLSLAENVYFKQRLPHLTALLSHSLAQIALMNRFLEEAVIFAANKRSRLVRSPEGREVCERLDAILGFIHIEMTDSRAIYEDGPNFIAVDNQWRSLVARYLELRQQVEFVD
jgi:hypothetical protein